MESKPLCKPATVPYSCRAALFTATRASKVKISYFATRASKVRISYFARGLTPRACTKPCEYLFKHVNAKLLSGIDLVGFCSRFFNDVFSAGKFGGFWPTLRAFYDGDAYLALPLYFKVLDEVVSTRALTPYKEFADLNPSFLRCLEALRAFSHPRSLRSYSASRLEYLAT
jgi:hypothetical protein